jgi:hypothetical protein
MHPGYKPSTFIAQFEILILTSCHDGFTGVMTRLREERGEGEEREGKRERGKKVSSSSSWYYRPAGASTSCNRGYSYRRCYSLHGDLHRSNIQNPRSQCLRQHKNMSTLVCEFAE